MDLLQVNAYLKAIIWQQIYNVLNICSSRDLGISTCVPFTHNFDNIHILVIKLSLRTPNICFYAVL